MKLGFVTAILAKQSLEEVIDYASAQGFVWGSGMLHRRWRFRVTFNLSG